MKRLFQTLSTILTFCLITAESFAEENPGTQIDLERISSVGKPSHPSRAPKFISLSLKIVYDANNNTLVFYDEDEDFVTYSIYNEENGCVMQGVCCFDEDGLCSDYIGTLQYGTYYITVQINGIEFWGTFEVKQQ